MKVCALLPLKDCANLKILSAFILHKIFEISKINVSFLIITDSPHLGSSINLLTGANCLSLPVEYFSSSFGKAFGVISRGAEILLIILPGIDFDRWFNWIIENNIQTVITLSDSGENDFFRFCADHIFNNSDIVTAVLDFSDYNFKSKSVTKIKGFKEVIPSKAYAEYHIPKYDYTYLQNLVHQVADLKINIKSKLNFSFPSSDSPNHKLNICFTEDAYFNYTYKENIIWLASKGFKISTISPVLASEIPESTELLWITGGNIFDYINLVQSNKKFLKSLAGYLRSGKALVCEGLNSALLCNSIKLSNEYVKCLDFLDLEARFCLRSAKFCELKESSRFQFGVSSFRGFNSPQVEFNIELPNFYYRYYDDFDTLVLDFFLPASNIILTNTYIPFYLNEKFIDRIFKWALNCSKPTR